MSSYKHTDKKSNDGLAITEWNNLSSAVAGSSGLTLAVADPASQVGIGATNPSGKLHIINSSQDSSGNTLILGPTSTSHLRLGYHDDYSWLQSQGSKPLALNATGNKVGIGTTSPSEKLQVNGNVKATKFIGDGSELTNLSMGLTGLNLATESGKVGIGTTSPGATLHVQRGTATGGTAIFSGTNRNSHFNYSTDEHTYIRGGKTNSYVLLNENGGNVGIGTDTPTETLAVNGTALIGNTATWSNQTDTHRAACKATLTIMGGHSRAVANCYYLNHERTDAHTGGGTGNYSIYASARVNAAQFEATSDARIKNSIGVSNSSKDLQQLQRLKITDYRYIDRVAKGTGEHKKLIAQEVQKVFPQAVSVVTDFIPNVYELTENIVFDAKAKQISVTTIKEHGFEVGDCIKVIDEKSEDVVVEVLKVIDANTFKVARETPIEKLFVFGKEVDDFLLVDYDAIAMLNVSATQELAKQLAEQNKVIAELRAQIKAQ